MTQEILLNLTENVKISNNAKEVDLQEVENKIKEYLSNFVKNNKHAVLKDKLQDLILEYIANNANNWDIKQFRLSNGNIDIAGLNKRIIDDILNYGPIEDAVRDPKINEIRSLGRWIEVVDNKNHSYFLKTKNGERAHFNSPEEQEVIISKMLPTGSKPLNFTNKLLNVRTLEGYRLSAIHHSATATSNIQDEQHYSDFTLRKFRDEIFTLKELVDNRCMTTEMGRLLKYSIAHESIIVVGRTGSGKTTTLRSLLEEIPDHLRVISIQQPTEYDLRKYNKKGELINDRLMWEADEDAIEKDKEGNLLKFTNTLNNEIAHSLRNTPRIIAINEIRHPDEFESAILIGQAGHCVNLTFHAEDAFQASQIFTNKIIAHTNQSYEVGLLDFTSIFKFIVVQNQLEDGSRIVTDIIEVLGVDPTNKSVPLLNPLYTYEIYNVSKDNKGFINKLEGKHKKIGNLSEKTKKKMNLLGFLAEDINKIDPDYKTMENLTYEGKSL